ncbi:helix-turn-helix domain-containing protein [Streptomyces sp. CC208A]|uniref:ArsR/SmtB family transcription factor n=1 Tax=Streptomyces sp. CC208A TaxID=3044573 RepID=UPI0024A7D07E|nr:helix-turn-helix domain-containing protein [Streptomyces sp. CC208A]
MPEKDEKDEKTAKAPQKHDTRMLDPRSLRGLAHPLRIQLLRTLRHQGPATASRLAERLGESSGATSYHLRQLAAHGFVEDDPALGKGRERWWKAVQQGISWDESLYHDPDPEVRGAADLLLHEVATNHTQELSTWIATRDDWPDGWAGASDMSDFTLRLPPGALRELTARMHALIDEYRDAPEAEAPDAARVRLHLHAFPQRED